MTLLRYGTNAHKLICRHVGKDEDDDYTHDIPFSVVPKYSSFCKAEGLGGIRIGVPRKIITASVDQKETLNSFDNALELMKQQGAVIVENADFPAFEHGWTQKNRICSHVNFRAVTKRYLSSLAKKPHGLRDIDDIIKYIESHKEEEFPHYSTATLKMVLSWKQTTDSEEYREALKLRTFMGSEGGILGALQNHDCDVLALPTDSDNPTDIAGYPAISVPLGFGSTRHAVVRSHPHLVDRGPQVP